MFRLSSIGRIALMAGVAAMVATACGGSTGNTGTDVGKGALTGAGATFPGPFYQKAFADYAIQYPQVTINYQAVGSGAGITALEGKTVDFGASDPPLKGAEESALAKVGEPVQIPMFLGAITVSYNLPGVKAGLKLDGTTLADIFLGKITTWNDAAIKALNPGVTLPSTPITVIHRSDSSGTSAGFTGFLAAVDPEWKSKVGSGKIVPWPVGTGAKGNAGVAGAVQQTTGAVGYVEQAYALQHGFTYASVKNKAGNYVAPTLASTTAAAEGVVVPANLGFAIKNPSAPGAYPITSQTFVVAYKDMCRAGVPGGKGAAEGVVKFLDYGLGAGQAILSKADYAALPPSILAKSKAAVAGLQCEGSPLT
jgi:phosphate transport system substrate-binding protein